MAQAAEALQDALRRLHIPFDAAQFQWQGIVPVQYKEHAGDARGLGWRGVTRYSLGRPPYIEASFALRYCVLGAVDAQRLLAFAQPAALPRKRLAPQVGLHALQLRF